MAPSDNIENGTDGDSCIRCDDPEPLGDTVWISYDKCSARTSSTSSVSVKVGSILTPCSLTSKGPAGRVLVRNDIVIVSPLYGGKDDGCCSPHVEVVVNTAMCSHAVVAEVVAY